MDKREAQLVAAMLEAYRSGVFPMADPDTHEIEWYSPDPRALMPLWFEPDENDRCFHVSRSLASRIRSRRFTITTDVAFESVIRSCGEPRPERPDSWIDERIVHAYTSLFRAGHAHSVEAWLPVGEAQLPAPEKNCVTPVLSPDRASVLVGGVYGVSIGAAFFAESMFCRPELGVVRTSDGHNVKLPGTDASKIALFHLVSHLKSRGYTIMDVQFDNPHIDRFGVFSISRAKYLRLLRDACKRTIGWLPFDSGAVSPASLGNA